MDHFQVSEKQHNNFWNLAEMCKSKEEEGGLVNWKIIDGILPDFQQINILTFGFLVRILH